MHFPIIKLARKGEDVSINMDDLRKSSAVQQYTDYVGHKYSAKERKDEISSEWFKDFFSGIADVDVEKETITFHSEDTIRHTLEDYFDDVMFKLSTADQSVYNMFFRLRDYGTFYEHTHALFDIDGVVLPSMAFIEDAHYFAKQTYHIGEMYDAHY